MTSETDVLSYADELESILSNSDDEEFQVLNKIKSSIEDSKKLQIRKEAEINMAIEALQKDMGEASKVKRQIDVVQCSKNASLEKVQELREQCQRLEENKREHARIADQSNIIRQAKHQSNLYSSVCKIRWQFDSQPDEIKGFVLNSSGVKPFCLNQKENSQFFITNYLWDLMEPDWDSN
ncbi:kinetochore protein Spc24-like [Lineus longissimus]|uniref:kinetochore protein Spc24-like n=1 Tax=Lineus longissimus TaxID=88925 RepID=UPI002B4EB8CB